VICRRGDANDLALVRQVLATGFVGFSPEDVIYLRRYGEWIDIALITDMVDRPVDDLKVRDISLAAFVGG
jgi:hypothetical protein